MSELPEPELTPLEEWRTKEGGPVEEPLTEPSSKVVCEKGDDDGDGDVDVDVQTCDKEEAKMDARTLCLLPRRTERERKLYL